MEFDPDQFLAETATPQETGFDPDKFLAETEPKSLKGFSENLGKDVVDTVGGVANLGKNLMIHPVDTAVNVATQLPNALINEGKRIGVGELLTGHPINALEKFGSAAYEKPLTTAFDVAPAVTAIGKGLGIGGKAASLAETAGEAANKLPIGEKAASVAETAGEVANKLPAGEKAANIAKETLSSLYGDLKETTKKPISDMGEFLKQKFGKAAANPKWKDILADYMSEHGQNVTLKELGAAPGQVRKIGVDKSRALADYAIENKLVGERIGTIGRERMIAKGLDDVGGAVGAFRKMAADRGAEINIDDLINSIRSQLDQKYISKINLGENLKVGGIHSGEANSYLKGLAELKKAANPGTNLIRADDLANKISELFSEAKGLDRLKQPSGALSDVARITRDANHQAIKSSLTPEEMNIYEHALENYGALRQINEFVKRRASVEAGGRLGPGSGISRAAVQKFLDSVGYRIEAKVMKNLSEKIRSNPEIASTPKNLFRNYVDEAAEAIDEMVDSVQ